MDEDIEVKEGILNARPEADEPDTDEKEEEEEREDAD